MRDERLRIVDGGEALERQYVADMGPHLAADPAHCFAKQKGEAEGCADAAGELEQSAVLASNRIGRTEAAVPKINRPTKGCHGASSAGPNGCREVETAPAGKRRRQPPPARSDRAAVRERALVVIASRVLAKLIGRTWPRTSGIRFSVLMATTWKSLRTLATR